VKYVGPATVQISVLEASLVLQIAQEDNFAFADTMLRNVLADSTILDVLADSTILKAGVGIDQDMLELFRCKPSSPMDVSGRMDIGGIGGSHGRTSSLKNLAKTVLGVDLLKSKKLAMSPWGKAPLTDDQIAYAARDAWASAAILHELAERDPKTYSTQSLLDLVLAEECSVDHLDARAVARKEAKTKLFEIIRKEGEHVDRKDLSDEQLTEVAQFEKEMKELAPPRPFVFDVGPLGFGL
jgi:ribonuclease D